MPTTLNRRRFLQIGASAALATPLTGPPGILRAQEPSAPKKRPKPPAIERDLVKTFVGAAHGDLEKTRAMLDEHPGLLNATWDHGGGDFEMAIGGAGHMGRRDIAQFLIDRGGRFDIFVAAMMGNLQIVRAAITAFPATRSSLGPHGISLMAHAERGGAEAAEVVAYLKSLT